MTAPLGWSHRTSEVGENGLRVARTADAAELAAIAQALELPSCEEVKADYSVRAIGGCRYRMSGELSARLTQACVVTLEPVPARVKETFEVEFWPPESIPETAEGEMEVSGLPEIEPIEHAQIAAGRVVFETLAAALDPYPRKEGAALDLAESGEGDAPKADNPFAVLKKLHKDR